MINRNVSQRDHPYVGQRAGHGAQPYVVYHEFGGTAELSTTLAHAIADVTGYDVTDIGFALNDYVDPEALDRLFAPKPDGTPRATASLTFSLWDCQVTVSGSGRVVVTPTQSQRGPQYQHGAGYR